MSEVGPELCGSVVGQCAARPSRGRRATRRGARLVGRVGLVHREAFRIFLLTLTEAMEGVSEREGGYVGLYFEKSHSGCYVEK